MENLKINKLLPTQYHIRDIESILSMITYISSGGVFDYKTINEFGKTKNRSKNLLITICQFEDGFFYIRDGHHRILSIFLGGRKFLYESEYVIEQRKYNDFMELSKKAIEAGWVTPFDPRIEVRIADFIKYKKNVPKDINEALIYIEKGWKNGSYCMKRNEVKCNTMMDYIEKIKKSIHDYLWE